MPHALKSFGFRAGSIVALIVLWWAASRLMNDLEVLPGPGVIGAAITRDLTTDGPEGISAFYHIGITLARIFAAFAASMLAGIGIGLAMGLSRVLEHALLAVIPLMLTIPTS
jgi:ABC-type nitrate/sulfonate/bicarbonate transport system permease component